MKKDNYIVCIGGANIDYKVINKNITESFGGVARNVAENIAKLEIDVFLITFIGDDENGNKIITHSKKSGIKTEKIKIIPNEKTGIYEARIFDTGELENYLLDMDIYKKIDWKYLISEIPFINNAQTVFIEGNLPTEIINKLSNSILDKTKIIFDPATTEKANRLLGSLKNSTLILNTDELEAISGIKVNSKSTYLQALDKLKNEELKQLIVTVGKNGVFFLDKNEVNHYDSYEVIVKDVTGAGDSFISGFIYGLTKFDNSEISTLVKYGLKASSITINSEKTVSNEMTVDNINKIDEHL